jgi:hypothetical protein
MADDRDDRMDERLRDYASRWTAARPLPGGVSVPGGRGGRSWVPLAAAAAVVAVVAGVAFAVGPARERPPAASPTPPAVSPTPPPGPVVQPCEEGQVLATFTLEPRGADVAGTLFLLAKGDKCTLPRAPKVELLGDNFIDLGVRFAFEGADPEVVLSGQPRAMSLTWEGPFCPPATSLVVAMVTLRKELAVRQPLSRSVVPPCDGSGARTSRLRGRWDSWQCDETAYEVLSTSATSVPGGPAGSGMVELAVVMRNVSALPCEVNIKPLVRVLAADGRQLRLSTFTTDEMRYEPALRPGERVRAAVGWSAYCGPDPGAYTLLLLAGEARVPFTVASHPVPPCVPDESGRDEGDVESRWLDPLDRRTPSGGQSGGQSGG